MDKNFKIVKVDYKYCNYLRKYDDKVVYNAGSKELRPFIGVLFSVDGCEYFAPLSSPKDKHLRMKTQIDFVKIDNGKLGVVNFNNMIPVNSTNYELFDLDTPPITTSDKNRQILLKSQLFFLNRDIKSIIHKAINLYTKYKENKLPENIKSRCCNFILLEQVSKNYIAE